MTVLCFDEVIPVQEFLQENSHESQMVIYGKVMHCSSIYSSENLATDEID